MNILVEHTKAMLDSGNVIVLDGGYLVMSPEVFKYAMETACKESLHIAFNNES